MVTQDILLVDVGNSSVKWGMLNENNLSSMSQQLHHKDIKASFFINCWESLDKPEKILLSCVANQKILEALEQACDQLWATQVINISSAKEGFGLVNGYKQPLELGSDRWCSMIAALNETNSDFIVISCGSAVTIDVVTRSEKQDSGMHQGGYILPGLAMMKKSLEKQTADVKVDSEFKNVTLLPAKSTTDCVDSAILLSVVKLIETVYEQQRKLNKNTKCILSGGDASLVAELLSIEYLLMPDLVLRGLAVISCT